MSSHNSTYLCQRCDIGNLCRLTKSLPDNLVPVCNCAAVESDANKLAWIQSSHTALRYVMRLDAAGAITTAVSSLLTTYIQRIEKIRKHEKAKQKKIVETDTTTT